MSPPARICRWSCRRACAVRPGGFVRKREDSVRRLVLVVVVLALIAAAARLTGVLLAA